MAIQGFEADPQSLRLAEIPLPGGGFGLRRRRQQGVPPGRWVEPGGYGRIVRIDLEKHHRRIFTPIPWGSPS